MTEQDRKNRILRKEVISAFIRCIHRLKKEKDGLTERTEHSVIWEKSRIQILLDLMWYGKIITLDQMWLIRNYIYKNYGYTI